MTDKNICFDARMAQASGIGTYIRNLLAEMSGHPAPGYAMSLISAPHVRPPQGWPALSISSRVYSISEQLRIPWAFYRLKADLLHVPHYNIPAAIASRCVATVHDLIHLKFPEFLPSRLAAVYAHAFFHRWIPQTRAILTVSENTKRDMVEMLGIPERKIIVSPPGVPEGFRRHPPEECAPALASLKLVKGYFLYVGNLKEFKNVQRLLEAYKSLKRKHADAPAMVFVGKNFIPGFDRELTSTPSVRWISELSARELPSVYGGAMTLVFPSLYEGFGLPPLEAMACGTPVICSDRASLPEVVGAAAVLVDPLSVKELETAMTAVWQSPSLRLSLSEKGLVQSSRFKWNITAQKTFQAYQLALSA